ncbi:MAG: class I SAM-dependent methyltransferase [Phycisphaerae bacterium]|nr:class I SAM-dependent methyltransferase [Phycisphaerae bacterium]
MVTCRLCPSAELTQADRAVLDFEYRSPGAYTYWRCGTCGLLNIDPVPDDHTLGLAYPDTYHAYQPHANALARIMKRRYWRKKAQRCARYVKPDARILDAGCAFGDLLVELKRLGYGNVQGLDFNARVVEAARGHGLDVVQGELTSAGFEDESLDMIVMTNFIEHVHDPVGVLEHCRRLLRPGGVIVGETPNVDSWDYALFRRDWGGYHTPRHLYLFSDDNLPLLAEKAGFRVRSISSLLQPAHWALSMQNLLQDALGRPRLRNGRNWLFTPLLLLALPINLVQMLVSRTSLVEFVFEKDAVSPDRESGGIS